jgi:hypothetical protein
MILKSTRRYHWERCSPSMGLTVLALAMTFAGRVRADVFLDPVGGPGGSQFRARCADGELLTGVELRAGNDIDAIRPLCVQAFGPAETNTPAFTTGSGLSTTTVKVAFGTVNVPVLASGWFGGPGGVLNSVVCPRDQPIVVGMDLFSEGYDVLTVNTIKLFCGLAANQQGGSANLVASVFEAPTIPYKVRFVLQTQPKRSNGSFRCPAGLVAAGIHGRSGRWLDALGLICDEPRIAPPPASSANGVKAMGRVKLGAPSGPSISICEAARQARERNSPAAAGLEAQCRAQNPPVKALGRVKLSQPSGPPIPICDAAGAARDRNSPAAAGLEAQCLAVGGHLPPPATGVALSADELAAKGEIIANGDPFSAELRNQQPTEPIRRGFDIGMAAAEGQTEWGPGKQRMLDSLAPAQREGFKVATSFSLDRNRNAELAATGAAIADADATVAAARGGEVDVRYWLGFDIATAIFGDPALGAKGNTATGPGSLKIRDALSPPAQRGFDTSVAFHLSRRYTK